MNSNVLLIGGGGHCKSVLDSLFLTRKFTKVGIVDVKEKIGESILGVPIIGSDDDLQDLLNKGYKNAFVTIGSSGNPTLRIKLFAIIEELGFQIPNIIDPTAVLGNNVFLEKGIFIGKNSVVNSGSSIKKGAIINTGAIVEHDCVIEQFCHIAPGTVLGGGVYVGKNSHIGSNATIKQKVSIGADSIIGMGSIVTQNIEDKIMAFGNPCKRVKEL